MSRADLPIGTCVQVTPHPAGEWTAFKAKVVGYDLFRSKYEVAREYPGGQFDDGGWWAFPSEVEPINRGA